MGCIHYDFKTKSFQQIPSYRLVVASNFAKQLSLFNSFESLELKGPFISSNHKLN